MKAEIRADGLHIVGYVNVPGRESRPIRSSMGSFVEIIEQRAFQKAIDKADHIDVLLDHSKDKVLASTKNGTLKVREDNIGLRAETVITDDYVIEEAKKGHLKGWSFNIRNPKDSFEKRAEGELPLRRITDFDMDEISLILNKRPVYQSTSIEIRAEGEDELAEYRANMQEVEVEENREHESELSEYKKRLERI